MLTGCTIMIPVVGHSDRVEMRRVQSQLRCGMSLEQIQSVAQLQLRPVSGSRHQATHYIDRGFAFLKLSVLDGKLAWSELDVIDGYTSQKLERRIDHCQ
jgi:hypothetical protein